MRTLSELTIDESPVKVIMKWELTEMTWIIIWMHSPSVDYFSRKYNKKYCRCILPIYLTEIVFTIKVHNISYPSFIHVGIIPTNLSIPFYALLSVKVCNLPIASSNEFRKAGYFRAKCSAFFPNSLDLSMIRVKSNISLIKGVRVY